MTIYENSSIDEIEKAIKDLNAINKKIENDHEDIISLIEKMEKDLKEIQSKRDESKLGFGIGLGSSIGCSILSLITLNPLPLISSVIFLTSSALHGLNMDDYDKVLDYLRESLYSSRTLLRQITKTLENIAIIIRNFELRVKEMLQKEREKESKNI